MPRPPGSARVSTPGCSHATPACSFPVLPPLLVLRTLSRPGANGGLADDRRPARRRPLLPARRHPAGNVGQLEQAWVYRYGADDYFDGSLPFTRGTSSETTPILVDGRLIFTTPTNRVIALDPELGRELWTFDPGLDRRGGTRTCGPPRRRRMAGSVPATRARRASFSPRSMRD